MFPRALSERVDMLIDELIEDGGVDSASLASILMAARESVHHGYSMELSRRVWLASSELRPRELEPGQASLKGEEEGTLRAAFRPSEN